MPAYNEINEQSASALIAQASNSQEIIWLMDVHENGRGYNPFNELMGGWGGVKPIKEILDTRKVKGDTIVCTAEAPLGGRGVSGDGDRTGYEEHRKYGTFTVQVGWHWHGVGESKIASSQTVIGSTYDKSCKRLLREWLGRLKCDFIEATLLANMHERNTIRANNRSSVDALGTADICTDTTIAWAKFIAGGIQCKPINIGTSKGNQRILRYYFQGNGYLLGHWTRSSTWKALLTAAGQRGGDNYYFGGHLPEVDGCMVNNWTIEDSSGDAPQGAFCAPRAFLGVAITADNEVQVIKGGGGGADATQTAAAAAKTDVGYFQYFPNAAFTAFNRTVIPAVTGVNKYLMIMNLSGSNTGKFGFYTYQATNGNTITPTERLRASGDVTGDNIAVTTLTGSSIVWGTAPWESGILTDAHPVGSLIVPVNAKGMPYVRGYLFGQDAILAGYGSNDGTPSGAFGSRTDEKQHHGKNKAIGVEIVWGASVMKLANYLVNGYVVVEGACPLPGMPTIS